MSVSEACISLPDVFDDSSKSGEYFEENEVLALYVDCGCTSFYWKQLFSVVAASQKGSCIAQRSTLRKVGVTNNVARITCTATRTERWRIAKL